MQRSAAAWFAGTCVALSFGSIALAAQGISFSATSVTSPGAAPAQLTAQAPPSRIFACPVFMRAQHLADGSMVRTGNAHPKGMGQWLHLSLSDNPSQAITAATVTIHGYSNKGRITQAAGRNGAFDAAQTMTVPLSATSPQLAVGDVWAPGMTAVATIDLDAVTYADGSTSSFTGQPACRIAPDPLMLITSR